MAEPDAPGGPLAPLAAPVYRMLWVLWVAANSALWMNDVAAAWVMTSLAPSPIWVALVQCATALPVFLLSLPSGALADSLDRRMCLIWAQVYTAAVAAAMFALLVSGHASPMGVLALTFANGAGMAMTWSVYAALTPQVVSRGLLPQAVALNSLGMNASRIAGPLLAGVLISQAGSSWVYLATSSVATIAAFALLRWGGVPAILRPPAQGLLREVAAGLLFALGLRAVRAMLLRSLVFYFHGIAVLALLPLMARSFPGATAATFSLLLASMGAGAIVAALVMPRLRGIMDARARVLTGAAIHAAAGVALASSPSPAFAAASMFLAGFAWLGVGNTLSVEVQLATTDAMRARTMSVYQLAMMGSCAAGAAAWGAIAGASTVPAALAASSILGLCCVAAVHWYLRRRT